ncbi:MAG: cytochrome c family protein [Spirochaetes bacterium]|jgi:hypothetical protein|nr:cytochrome c family protein [Spirochaetota bacterium]
MIFSILILSSCFTVLLAQQELILIDNAGAFGGSQRPAVKFPHGTHIAGGLECKACHHKYSEGKNMLDESALETGNNGIKCAACHNYQTEVNLMRAFHKQCTGCHGRIEKSGRKSGPRLCGGCHKKSRLPVDR